MKIIVVGCGKIGKTIVQSLVSERHDVLAIDVNPAVIEEITNQYDVMGLCGNGTEYDRLKEAEAGKADLFIAVTGSDELNMLSCFAAKRMGARHTVARIRNSENNYDSLEFMKTQLDLSMAINPEMTTAQAICNLLKFPSATKVETFGSHGFEMIELLLKPNSPMDGMSLMGLKKKLKANFLICTIGRGEQIYIPRGNFKLKSGDRIGLICSEEDTQKVLKVMGVFQKQVGDVTILGASRTSYYLAEMLIRNRISVKIIEKNKERCEEFCEQLPKATVICGDGMSQDLLLEEGITTTDAFVALTGKDEENILISFYAMSQKVPKIISKVNREELSSIAENLGLESIVSPKKTVSDILVRYACALQSSVGSKMETLYSLMNGKAEAIEFKVMGDFAFTNIPLREMKFRNNVILAGIIRNKRNIIPSGDDCIQSGDRVIIIAAGHVYDLSDVVERNAQ